MNNPITNFFASLYEWFGLNPFYGIDLGDQLRGWDPDCSGNFTGPQWYSYIGGSMIIIIAIIYVIQYHIIDSPRFMRRHHWWIMALILFILNFLVAFTIPFNAVQSGNYCSSGDNALNLSTIDCVGFGFSNALWALLIFALITSVPWLRKLSNNCRFTTFWKP